MAIRYLYGVVSKEKVLSKYLIEDMLETLEVFDRETATNIRDRWVRWELLDTEEKNEELFDFYRELKVELDKHAAPGFLFGFKGKSFGFWKER